MMNHPLTHLIRAVFHPRRGWWFEVQVDWYAYQYYREDERWINSHLR